MASASREQNSSAGALEAEQLKMDHRVTAQSPPSDNDSGERPVRQQLKETNLDSVGEKDGSARANRKRSFDNTDGANDTPPTKRSRECTPDNNSNHAGIPKDATTQDVSDVVLPKAPANTSVHNTPLSHNPIMSHIPETKVQFPLDLEIKVSIAGSEQISHLTIPVEVGIKVTAGVVSLASPTSRSAEGESSKIHITIPSPRLIPPSGNPSPGHPSPGHSSPGHSSPGHPSSEYSSSEYSSEHPSSGHPSSEYSSSEHPSSGHPSSEYPPLGEPSHGHRSHESYIHDDPSFHIYEEPESIGDSSSEDSLPDYRSPEYPSSPPPDPYSPTNPNYPNPMVQIIDSNDSQSPQSLETTAGGNEDESSQTLKKKRSREQLEDDASKNSHTATDPAPGLTETTSDEKSTAEGQPEKKRPRDNSEERKAKVEQTFTASAFGKASAAPSPFAMPGTKSTSDASPFATSGASTTGFGAVGSGFSAFGSAFPATSGKLTSFASPNAPTAFSGTAGKLTSFASANAPTSFSGTAGKLTSFASPNAPVSFDVGADQSDNEEIDDGTVGEPDGTFVAEKTDRRFHAQPGMDPSLPLPPPWIPHMARNSFEREHPVETGEENESTEFTAKGKLYYFDDKKWKERGTGTFKLNLKTESNGKKSARIIMRADGALRVMLNSAVWHTMPFGDAKGSRPTTRDIYLASNEDERVVSLLLRLGNEKQTGDLFDVVKDVMEKI
ncbi:Pleckstrin homology-type [Penicillium camemberti]|uniref:Pleckstrin homology-type n=1 Tax=Penicillium camemberti (strain FM 013) TaxID=1429867 RepID=A0A0G4NWL6_PENC3|nr:Pleckstrin homology-type [Penicillium camemberti]